MIENVTQIKNEIKIHVGERVKIQKNVLVQKIIFGILLYVFPKMVNI